MEQNIEIAVRIKPTEHHFISPLYYYDHQTIQIADKSAFNYDYVLPPQATQQEIFEKIGFKIISNVLEGYNGCIFAYGQTGSGKTYTMTGYQPQQGIIQKCLRTLWNCVHKSEFCQIKLSYFQIYNQTIKDLLSDKENLTIRENAKSGFYIEGLTQKVIDRFQDFQELIAYGISVRTVKQTKMNQTSSRSHSVLQVNVAYKKSQQRGLNVLKHSKITFIDLAGSEKQKQTQVQGQRLKQAANINKSLSNLSLVISKLSQMSQKKQSNSSAQAAVHVPYRNSVLTKILKSSLTGKSKIIIVCTISLDEKFLDETLSTLRFAQTAKSIKMKVKKNEQQFDGTKQRLFEEFQEFKARYNQIKQQLQESQKSNEQLRRQNARLKDEVQMREAELNQLQINFECLKIESKQIVREMKSSQSINPPMSQGLFFEPMRASQSQFRSQTQFQPMNSSWSQRQPVLQQSAFDHQFSMNSSNQDIFNPNLSSSHNSGMNYSSQLSFFTTNLSSQLMSTPQKTFFTIDEADEKEQLDHSSQFIKISSKIKTLEKQVCKFQIEREFFLMDISQKQEQIKELLKRQVFLEEKQKQMQIGHDMFKQMMANKQFTHAQLKFLKLCIQKSHKDRMAFQLIQEEKNNQKRRFLQGTQNVKQLLLKHVQNSDMNARIMVDEKFSDRSFSKSKINSQQRLSENLKIQDFESHSVRKAGSEKQEQKVSSQKKSKVYSESKCSGQKNIMNQQVNFPPLNYRNMSQVRMMPQMSQSMGNFIYPSSQMPMFVTQNRSMMSQSSFRFTNNELEYLKRDYERLQQDLKSMKQEIQRKNIMLLEKESLLSQKQIEFQQLIDRNQKLIQDIIAENEMKQLEKKKRRSTVDNQIYQKQLNQKQTELRHLRNHLQETAKKHQLQLNAIKLEKKALQASINRHSQTIDSLKTQNEQRKQLEEKLRNDNEKLCENIKKLKEEIKNLQIDKGFLDSENQVLLDKYNELKAIVKNLRKVQTPKKVYKQRVSCYSLSPSQQNVSQSSLNSNKTSAQKSSNMTDQQCIEIIETRRHQDMHTAAYHFYKLTQKLYSIQQILEKKYQQTKGQLAKMNKKVKELQDQRIEAIQKALGLQRMYMDSKDIMLGNRQRQVQLRSALIDKKEQIALLQQKNNQLLKRCQFLEAKLLQRQHKELQSRQKVNELTTQIRQNSIIHQTPLNQKSKFNYKRRITSQSSDSLSSNQTVVRASSYINDSKKSISPHSKRSIEIPLNEYAVDRYDFEMEIEQVSNEQSKKEDISQKLQFDQSCSSIASKTITNSQLKEGEQSKSKRKSILQLESFSRRNTQQLQKYELELLSHQNDQIKPNTIKSQSNLIQSNLFKPNNKNIFSKK